MSDSVKVTKRYNIRYVMDGASRTSNLFNINGISNISTFVYLESIKKLSR